MEITRITTAPKQIPIPSWTLTLKIRVIVRDLNLTTLLKIPAKLKLPSAPYQIHLLQLKMVV
jgi:hypothetical protein